MELETLDARYVLRGIRPHLSGERWYLLVDVQTPGGVVQEEIMIHAASVLQVKDIFRKHKGVDKP